MYENIGDSVIKTLLTTDYTIKKLNILTIYIITLIIRSILISFIIFLITTGIFYVDFISTILVSIIIILKTQFISYIVLKYEDEIFKLSDYLIKNYNHQNFRKWKKLIVLFICFYYIIYLLLYPVNSNVLIQYIIQFLICYFIVDNIENRNGLLFDTYTKIVDKRYMRFKKLGDITIIENYRDDYEVENNAVEVENNRVGVDNNGVGSKRLHDYEVEDFLVLN